MYYGDKKDLIKRIKKIMRKDAPFDMKYYGVRYIVDNCNTYALTGEYPLHSFKNGKLVFDFDKYVSSGAAERDRRNVAEIMRIQKAREAKARYASGRFRGFRNKNSRGDDTFLRDVAVIAAAGGFGGSGDSSDSSGGGSSGGGGGCGD